MRHVGGDLWQRWLMMKLPRKIEPRKICWDEMAGIWAWVKCPCPGGGGRGARCYEEGDVARGKIPIRRKAVNRNGDAWRRKGRM